MGSEPLQTHSEPTSHRKLPLQNGFCDQNQHNPEANVSLWVIKINHGIYLHLSCTAMLCAMCVLYRDRCESSFKGLIIVTEIQRRTFDLFIKYQLAITAPRLQQHLNILYWQWTIFGEGERRRETQDINTWSWESPQALEDTLPTGAWLPGMCTDTPPLCSPQSWGSSVLPFSLSVCLTCNLQTLESWKWGIFLSGQHLSGQ